MWYVNFQYRYVRKKGEHWIALCITKENIFYFDSLNHNFIFLPDIAKFFVRVRKNILYNKLKTQPDHSNTCGIQCIVFCSYMSTNMSTERFENFFKSYIPLDVEERDKLISMYYVYITNI